MLFYKDTLPVTELHWDAPSARVDGTVYGATDHAGYELGVEESGAFIPFVSVPAVYSVTSWPLADLNFTEERAYSVALRTIDTAGRVSAWSAPVVFTVALASPNSPTNLRVS